MLTESFHKHFPSKQECFLAVVDEFVDETIETIAAAAARADSWEEAAYIGVKAGIDYFAAHPGLTKMAFVDLFEVGPARDGEHRPLAGQARGLLARGLARGAPRSD